MAHVVGVAAAVAIVATFDAIAPAVAGAADTRTVVTGMPRRMTTTIVEDVALAMDPMAAIVAAGMSVAPITAVATPVDGSVRVVVAVARPRHVIEAKMALRSVAHIAVAIAVAVRMTAAEGMHMLAHVTV